jgi:hypothetical protein
MEDVGLAADDGHLDRALVRRRVRHGRRGHGHKHRACEREDNEQLAAAYHGRASTTITLVCTPLK